MPESVEDLDLLLIRVAKERTVHCDGLYFQGINFRLLRRLFVQIERILRINELSVITEEVVNAA